ncbi:hypothetical protein VU04_07790 [Desulfobulbus sp. TB]|nr:hypothetical protein [Desulfobulbus sp. TB]
MKDSDILKLQLQVHEDDADEMQIEQLTQALTGQLRALDIESVDRVKAVKSIQGTKGEPFTTGAVMLAITVAAIPGLISLLQQWVGSTRKVSVEAPNGAKAEFTPQKRYSEDEIAALIERLNQLPVKEHQ